MVVGAAFPAAVFPSSSSFKVIFLGNTKYSFNFSKYIIESISILLSPIIGLIFLDIDATKENRKPNIGLIHEIATECFMPFSYGGGINNLNDITEIIKACAEKVIINGAALSNEKFIKDASIKFGSSTIIVSIDVKTPIFTNLPKVYSNNGKRCMWIDPLDHAKNMEKQGAGEIFINSIDNYLEFKDRIGVNPYLMNIEGYKSFDIDWPEDFKIAEKIKVMNGIELIVNKVFAIVVL